MQYEDDSVLLEIVVLKKDFPIIDKFIDDIRNEESFNLLKSLDAKRSVVLSCLLSGLIDHITSGFPGRHISMPIRHKFAAKSAKKGGLKL